MDTLTQNIVLRNLVESHISSALSEEDSLIDRVSLRIVALLPFQKHFVLQREGHKYFPSLADRFCVDSS